LALSRGWDREDKTYKQIKGMLTCLAHLRIASRRRMSATSGKFRR